MLSSTWSVEKMWLGGSGEDFRTKIKLSGYSLSVYIDVAGAYYRAVQSVGLVGVAVPTPRRLRHRAPDGVWVTDIVRFVGSEDERSGHPFGSSGDRFEEVEDHCRRRLNVEAVSPVEK